MKELTAIFSRPYIRKKFKILTDKLVTDFLALSVSCSEDLREPPAVFTLPRDPDDESYLNLAIAGKASYLVSWNERHLNYLMPGDTPEGKDFCARFPDLKILTPPELLIEIRKSFSPNE